MSIAFKSGKGRKKWRKEKEEGQTENYFDYSLLFIVLFLLGFGLVMIYSTSCYEANMQGHESTFYLKKTGNGNDYRAGGNDCGSQYPISFLGAFFHAGIHWLGGIDFDGINPRAAIFGQRGDQMD